MKIVCIKKKNLNKLGYRDLEDWLTRPNDPPRIYGGRDMSFYVKGAKGSILQNPYPIKKYGLQECLRLYREYYRSHPEVQAEAERVKDYEVGCYCEIDMNDDKLQCHLEVIEEELTGTILIHR